MFITEENTQNIWQQDHVDLYELEVKKFSLSGSSFYQGIKI